MGNFPSSASIHGEKKHHENTDLIWSSCTYDCFLNTNLQLRTGRTIFFPLTGWITGMKTQNLLGMDFCQKQVSGIHFDLPEIELKRPPNTVCYGSLHQNKSYPFISQILTMRTPHAMHIEAKSARCWKDSLEDPHSHSPPRFDQIFIPIAMLSLRDYHSSMCYALNQNQNYLYQWKKTKIT